MSQTIQHAIDYKIDLDYFILHAVGVNLYVGSIRSQTPHHIIHTVCIQL